MAKVDEVLYTLIMSRKLRASYLKNSFLNWVGKIFNSGGKGRDLWAENLFSDLKRLGGQIIVMQMG